MNEPATYSTDLSPTIFSASAPTPDGKSPPSSGAGNSPATRRSRAQAGEIPYGLRISEDCLRLEIDPEENRILMEMMELLVQDFPFTNVASDLNERGYRTREGKRWTAVSVFNMLPRLVETGPTMFPTEEWEARRQHFAKAI